MIRPDGPAGEGPAATCPWCGSDRTSELRAYGSLLMTSQWFCDACRSPFERIRHRGGGDPPATPPPST